MKRFIVVSLSTIIISILTFIIIYIIPPKKYDNDYFHIKIYISETDFDNDGIDDQTDIINNAFAYIGTKPKYKSAYYATGYPDDEYGVCTDLVGISLLNAGYDLRNLVNQDIINNKELYDIDVVDKNIDFRRVRNLLIYFKRNSINLTTDYKDISSWQGGDIVIFKDHIGIVSSNRNRLGISLVLHHANPFQVNYEEDILSSYEIVGHFRIS